MKLGCLISGGKDSLYAAFLAKCYQGEEISCLITVESENSESFMFHTPSIAQVKKQAEAMGVPLVIVKTKGVKEVELNDLKKAIKKAIKEYGIEGIVTGAVESVYQASRVQKICNDLKIECFNPLWQKEQEQLIKDLINEKFEVIITAVMAYLLDEKWIGRKINNAFLKEVKQLNKKHGISIAGEGGEFETFVLNCPLFKRGLKIKDMKISGERNSWRAELELK